MSDKDSSTDSGNQIPDLSALNFGPAWARDKPKGKPRSRQNSDGGGERQGERQGQHRPNQQRSRQGGDRRYQSGGRDSREGFRGKGRRDDRGGQKQGGYERKPITPAPDGVTGRIMPIEEGLDALAKDITATGRTHSVFDIAWMVLGGLERFHVVFESETQPLYRNKNDHSLWVYQKECMAHFWAHGIIKKYYDEEEVDVDPPKGNFQSVARCGLSGTLIGPPNHHAYQKTVLELHRNQFSNMALDRYKSKIVMEHSEEAVQEWVDSMTKHVRWRPKSEKVEVVVSEEAQDSAQVKSSEAGAEVVEVTEPTEVTEVTEVTAEVAEVSDEPTAEVEPSEDTKVSIEETVVILDSHQEVEQHFLSHGFDQEFESGKIMSVLANVPAKMIDPGLFTLLKTTVTEERRYPGKLASILCRQLSGRHLAVFKWKKHLHCGPARPRKVPDDMVMAERPSQIFHWVISNPGGNIDAMWKALFPEDIDDATKHLWYHDLHWLINEGIALLFSDGKLHAAKELQKPKKQQKSKKAVSKKGKKSESKKTTKPKVETDSTKEIAPVEAPSETEDPEPLKESNQDETPVKAPSVPDSPVESGTESSASVDAAVSMDEITAEPEKE